MQPISRRAFAGTMMWLGLAALSPLAPADAASADLGTTAAAQGDQSRPLPSNDVVQIPAKAADADPSATAAAPSMQNRPPLSGKAVPMPVNAAAVDPGATSVPPSGKIARRPRAAPCRSRRMAGRSCSQPEEAR